MAAAERLLLLCLCVLLPLHSSKAATAIFAATAAASAVAKEPGPLVPFTIWQTFKTSKLPVAVQSLRATWSTLNPGVSMYLHTDEEASRLMNTTFGSEVGRLYRGFPLGAMRADFWRYAVLYAHGGVYTDADTKCLVPVSSWLPPKDNAAAGLPLERQYNEGTTWRSCPLLVGMENDVHFCQWTIAGVAGHGVLREVIKLIVRRAREAGNITVEYAKINKDFVHLHSGPAVWTDAIKAFLAAHVRGVSDASMTALKGDAASVFRVVHSDAELYRQVRELGICLVGSKFLSSVNVVNLYGSKHSEFKNTKDWAGYASWLEEKRDFVGAKSLWDGRRRRRRAGG